MATERSTDPRPLVMHVVYRFDTGGLENGLANLINRMPEHAWRHMVVALTEVTDFRARVRRGDVEFVALGKGPGHAWPLYPALWRLMRRHRPAIVHTRNLAALEAVLPAWAAGVPVRIHGEHGRDVGDLDGSNARYQRVRRLYRPFVHHHVALSNDLADYLQQRIGVLPSRLTTLCNGVDTSLFMPAGANAPPAADCPFDPTRHWTIGTIGRMQAVKNQPLLVDAFLRLLAEQPALRERLRLVLAGDGPLRAECRHRLEQAGALDLAWLPGERADVPALMRSLQCFVLPSLAEGISNTVLEAMASALPVIATDVGGNAELVQHGVCGLVVPSADAGALAHAVGRLAAASAEAASMGRAARARAVTSFSLQAMVDRYADLYTRQLPRSAATTLQQV